MAIKKLMLKRKMLFLLALFFRDLASLLLYLKNGSFSQYGEDRIFKDLFKGVKRGRYLDLGASHPFRISNTYLLYVRGWSGTTVEPINYLYKLQKFWRSRDRQIRACVGIEEGSFDFYEMLPSVLSTLDSKTAELQKAQGAEIVDIYKVPVISINELLEKEFTTGHLDLLCIDIEGMDMELLKGIRLDIYRPTVICVEANDFQTEAEMLVIFKENGYDAMRNVDNIIAIDQARLDDRLCG